MGIQIATMHATKTMFDKTKGSFTNRTECAKEHIKNDIKSGVKIAVPAAAAASLILLKPQIATKIVRSVGKGIIKGTEYLTKTFNKVGLQKIAKSIGEIANKIKGKSGKVGLIALGITGATYMLNTISNWIYKSGQIDQKYTDSAKIEERTKNVILENMPHKCTPEEIKEFYAHGGHGIY